jgi:hypothetical protein
MSPGITITSGLANLISSSSSAKTASNSANL